MPAQKRAAPKGKASAARKIPKTREAKLDAAVTKALYDNFRSWPEELIHVKKVEGQTVAQKIREDKQAGSVPMGGPYYDKLRQEYKADGDITRVLAATNPGESVNPELMRAMIRELLLLIPDFLKVESPKEGGGKETVTGAKALQVLYTEVQGKVNDNKATMQDLEPFVVYSYLAVPEDQTKYRAMVEVVKARVGAVGAPRRARARGAGAAAAAAASNTAADAAVQSAMDMFT
jgi:hypothetical protein